MRVKARKIESELCCLIQFHKKRHAETKNTLKAHSTLFDLITNESRKLSPSL